MSFDNLFNQSIKIEERSKDAIEVKGSKPKKKTVAVKSKSQIKPKRKGLSKQERKAWWQTRTPEQQADFIYEKMLEEGRNPDWQSIYTKVIEKNQYQH